MLLKGVNMVKSTKKLGMIESGSKDEKIIISTRAFRRELLEQAFREIERNKALKNGAKRA